MSNNMKHYVLNLVDNENFYTELLVSRFKFVIKLTKIWYRLKGVKTTITYYG